MNYIEYLEGGKSIRKKEYINRTFSKNWIPEDWEDSYKESIDLEAFKEYVRDFVNNFKKNFNINNQVTPSYGAVNQTGDIVDASGNVIGHFNLSDYSIEASSPNGTVYRPKSSF